MIILRPYLLPPAIAGHKPVPLTSSFLQRFQIFTSGEETTHPTFKLNLCKARRRVRYEEDDNGEEEQAHNAEIAMFEAYTESVRTEALLVRAIVDGEEEQVLVFKGYSSSLSSRTAVDPSKRVLPAQAIIQSIDVIKGPFDPSSIQYLHKGLTLEEFKVCLQRH